jgi:2-phosphosulfolactate phosphatase
VTIAPDDWFSQPHRVRMDWGWRGARNAAARGDAVVVVDVLRFSTAAIAAAERRVIIYPAANANELKSIELNYGASATGNGLAPASYDELSAGQKFALYSPNGATCVRRATEAPAVLIGALVNASAVAECINWMLKNTTISITVLACGERWHGAGDGSEDGALRFAVEDYLGAGAILSMCAGDALSPEARVCAGAFGAAISNLKDLILRCGSGIEQIAKNDRLSVERAAKLDLHRAVPVLHGDSLIPLENFEILSIPAQTLRK